jgi:hypothetical protein
MKRVKARGVKLGRHGAEVLAPKYQEEAHERAKQLEPLISELKGSGLSLAKIAAELNRRKVATPRGTRGRASLRSSTVNALSMDHLRGSDTALPISSRSRLRRMIDPRSWDDAARR